MTRLAGLANIPLHPTPLYSILWNIFTGIVLARLWFLHTSPHMVTGVYLLLNGLGRFVEESYRGEPQTPKFGRIRLYQVAAIVSVLLGVAFTSVGTTVTVPTPVFGIDSILSGAVFGVATFFALGVDFPGSNRRFARLV